ncbi:hypothetical protein DFR48_10741 [Ciceribacter lividus]|uniref:Uncharacterized protein n=1 Tax=Ciceribacter lividus TaxID=1197950 RepID=A0A6I7HK28_9HYPH|nr:hypothetical protein [Ciceribacter lividus]RCW23172.1 hypothetical protein DFR48_10741 [Ciceribacter lividus]
MDNVPLRGGEAVPAGQLKGNGMYISKIIDGLRYNTATAEEICSFENDSDRGDFRYEVTSLYRTPRGRFFVAGHGGAMTRWAQPVQGGQAGGKGLHPVSTAEAREFAEQYADEDMVARFFVIEDA